jgi:hypothetical protein
VAEFIRHRQRAATAITRPGRVFVPSRPIWQYLMTASDVVPGQTGYLSGGYGSMNRDVWRGYQIEALFTLAGSFMLQIFDNISDRAQFQFMTIQGLGFNHTLRQTDAAWDDANDRWTWTVADVFTLNEIYSVAIFQ